MSLIKKIKTFCSETKGELLKASWPSRKELGKSTIVVIIGMALFGMYISVIDFSLLNIVDFVGKCVRK